MLTLLSACWRPPRLVSASPFCLRGGLVEWRGVLCVAVSPCSDWAPSYRIVLLPLVLRVAGGEVRWRGLCPALLFSSALCVCCHSIVGLGWCLCGRTLLLWNGGDGLRWAEERWCVVWVV